METAVTDEGVKQATLKEAFKEFNQELSAISTRHREVQEKQREVYLEYHRTINEREDLLTIGEVEAAGALDQKIKDLRSQVDRFEKEITDLSPERIKQVVIEHPDSKLHIMALAIQTEGLKEIEAKLTEIGTTNDETEKAKQQYLSLVAKAGQQYRGLVDVHAMVRRAEEMLPEKKNKHLPKILNWTDLEIPEKELSRAFGKKPFINP